MSDVPEVFDAGIPESFVIGNHFLPYVPLEIYRGAERGIKAGNGCPCAKGCDLSYFYTETSVVRMMEIRINLY